MAGAEAKTDTDGGLQAVHGSLGLKRIEARVGSAEVGAYAWGGKVGKRILTV